MHGERERVARSGESSSGIFLEDGEECRLRESFPLREGRRGEPGEDEADNRNKHPSKRNKKKNLGTRDSQRWGAGGDRAVR